MNMYSESAGSVKEEFFYSTLTGVGGILGMHLTGFYINEHKQEPPSVVRQYEEANRLKDLLVSLNEIIEAEPKIKDIYDLTPVIERTEAEVDALEQSSELREYRSVVADHGRKGLYCLLVPFAISMLSAFSFLFYATGINKRDEALKRTIKTPERS